MINARGNPSSVSEGFAVLFILELSFIEPKTSCIIYFGLILGVLLEGTFKCKPLSNFKFSRVNPLRSNSFSKFLQLIKCTRYLSHNTVRTRLQGFTDWIIPLRILIIDAKICHGQMIIATRCDNDAACSPWMALICHIVTGHPRYDF